MWIELCQCHSVTKNVIKKDVYQWRTQTKCPNSMFIKARNCGQCLTESNMSRNIRRLRSCIQRWQNEAVRVSVNQNGCVASLTRVTVYPRAPVSTVSCLGCMPFGIQSTKMGQKKLSVLRRSEITEIQRCYHVLGILPLLLVREYSSPDQADSGQQELHHLEKLSS